MGNTWPLCKQEANTGRTGIGQAREVSASMRGHTRKCRSTPEMQCGQCQGQGNINKVMRARGNINKVMRALGSINKVMGARGNSNEIMR